MKKMLSFLLFMICLSGLVGCASRHSGEITPTGYPSGETQRQQVMYDGVVYFYTANGFDNPLPDGYALVGEVKTVDDSQEPVKDWSGSRVDVGQKIYASDDASVVYLEYENGYAEFAACGVPESAAVHEDAETAQEKKETSMDALSDEKSWTEQDIRAMFLKAKNEGQEFIDSVLIPDHAYGRVGAVLFRDDGSGTCNVAFFDGEGNFQQCGVSAEAADTAELAYLGEGTVSFRLKTDESTDFTCRISFSADGDNVSFRVEDDLNEPEEEQKDKAKRKEEGR